MVIDDESGNYVVMVMEIVRRMMVREIVNDMRKLINSNIIGRRCEGTKKTFEHGNYVP